jgi:hypothetical protein
MYSATQSSTMPTLFALIFFGLMIATVVRFL